LTSAVVGPFSGGFGVFVFIEGIFGSSSLAQGESQTSISASAGIDRTNQQRIVKVDLLPALPHCLPAQNPRPEQRHQRRHRDGPGPDAAFFARLPATTPSACELRCADFKVNRRDNALRPGIAAVSARIEQGTLRILEGRCPNLLAEAGLYRYGSKTERDTESPVDEHNHALAALRCLIAAWMPGGWRRRRNEACRAMLWETTTGISGRCGGPVEGCRSASLVCNSGVMAS
jgi:hypothetical protein